MNCVEYESVAIEDSTREKKYQAPRSMPFALLRDQERPGDDGRSDDRVDSTVSGVLDYELARGSMPT